MKIVRFLTTSNTPQYGVWEEDRIRLIAGNLFDLWAVSDRSIPLEKVTRILPPVDPPNIFAVGLNYRAHVKEGWGEDPTEPVIFIKATTSITAHDSPIILPASAPDEVDYEAELALIVGRKAARISESDALDHVLGYTVANDVTARDCQRRRDKQWARAKSFDTFCPLGPFIQTETDPDHVRVTSRLNGQTMQDSTTENLIFSCRKLVSFLSHQFTLLPGTVILTGTPEGVGFARTPPVFLREGDVIEAEVEGVGILSNNIVKA